MSSNNKIEIRSQHLDGAEISWFAPLCSDDYEFLGVPDSKYKRSHTGGNSQDSR